MVYEGGTNIDINSWEAIAIAILVPIVAFIYGYQEWLKNNPLLKPLFTSILAFIPFSLLQTNEILMNIIIYDDMPVVYDKCIPLLAAALPIVLYAIFYSFYYANKTKKRIKPILLTCAILAVYIILAALVINSFNDNIGYHLLKDDFIWWLYIWIVFLLIPILATLWWIWFRRRKFKKAATAIMNQQSNPQ